MTAGSTSVVLSIVRQFLHHVAHMSISTGLLFALRDGEAFGERRVPAFLQLFLHARRHRRGIDPAVREDAVGDVAVVGSGRQDDDAEPCFTRTIHAPGFGRAAMPAPANGHGIGHAEAEHERQRQRRRRSRSRSRLLENSTTWITTGATHAPASSAATRAHGEGQHDRCRGSTPMPTLPENREKSIVDTSNIASASTTNSTAMPRLNHGEELIVPNVWRSGSRSRRARRRRAPWRRRRRRRAGSRARASRLRAGADDREVDRDHRQHARREIQRQAAEKDEQQDRERSAALEESLLAATPALRVRERTSGNRRVPR